MTRRFLFSARLTLLVIIGLSAIALYGWLTHDIDLVRFHAGYVLMQYNTALCIILAALAMFASLEKKRVAVLAALTFVLMVDGATLLEYVTGLNLHVDDVFYLSNGADALPGRPGLNTAVALFLTSLVILTTIKRVISPREAMGVAIACSLIFAIGAVPLLGYFSGIQEAYRYGTFTRMSLPASTCFTLFGIILTLHAGYRSRSLYRWAALPVFLALVIISFSASLAVQMHEKQQIKQLLQERADQQAQNLGSHVHDLYAALTRIGLRWEAAGGTPHDQWMSDTQSYVHDLPYLSGVTLLDTEGRIKWLSSADKSNPAQTLKLIGKKVTDDPERAPTILNAIATRTALVTPPVSLYNNHGLGYLYARPLFVKDRYDGTIISVVSLPKMLAALSEHVDTDYYYALEHDTRVLFSTLPEGEERLAKWRVIATFTNLNDTYRLAIYPQPKFLIANRSLMSQAVLILGLMMSTLVAFTISILLKERLQAQHVRTAEQLTRTILESTNYLIVAADLNGNVLLFNPEAERALGYKAAEIVGKQTPMLWHDPAEVEEHLGWLKRTTGRDDLMTIDAFNFEALRYGRVEQEWTFIRKDRTNFTGQLTVTPRYSHDGELEGFLGIIKDMTEQKQQEAALRASEETFRMAMEQSPIGMALVSPEGRWLEVNATLCEIVGYKRNELLATDFQTVTHPEDLAIDLDLVGQVIDGTIKSYTLEKRYFHKQGKIIHILLSVSLVRNEDGTPKYFISMIQDVSERKLLMEQLQQTNAELEQFAYVASHDLQEPLRMVISFVGLIGSQYVDRLDEKGKEFITIAVESAKRMQALINDLLEYARIGRDSQVRIPIDCTKEMQHVLQNLNATIGGAKAKVELGPMPQIRGNPVEFLRLMQNLIGNGIKFHRDGVAPVISVTAAERDDAWEFAVADNGIGLKPEYYERIFQPFKRLHTQQEYHGSGIGLAVCRKIVENFGGRIWVESVVGAGTTIRFTVAKQRPIKEET